MKHIKKRHRERTVSEQREEATDARGTKRPKVAESDLPKQRTVNDLVTHVLEECVGWLSGVEICLNVRPVSKRWYEVSHGNGAWAEVKRRCEVLCAQGVPHPCTSLALERLEDEFNEEEYSEVLEYYRKRFGDGAKATIDVFAAFFEHLPENAADVPSQWWAAPRPAFRRIRQTWTRLATMPSIRTVKIGTDHIEEQLSYRNTFSDFESQVGDLWLTDLYTEMGFVPPPHETDCGCEMHVMPIHRLVVGERRQDPPQKLVLHTTEHHSFCCGVYELDKCVNGYPSWVKHSDVTSWIYSSPKAVWTVSNRGDDFDNGAGHIAAGSPHNGWLPQSNRDWMFGDGKAWYPDPTISIKGVPTQRLFLKDQQEITPRMRAIVVGWLSDIQAWQKGPLQMHTFHLAVSFTDQFLAVKQVSKGDLQLLACSATLLASRTESVLLTGDAGPSILDRMWHLSEETYTKQQVTDMAYEILLALGSNCALQPTVYLFLERYIDMVRDSGYFDPSIQDAAEYITELAVLQYDIVSRYRPSVIAAAGLLVAVRTLPVPAIPPVHELRLLDIDVELCAAELVKLIHSTRPWISYKKNLEGKYSTSAHGKIALVYRSMGDVGYKV